VIPAIPSSGIRSITPTAPNIPERAGNGGGTSKRASTLTPGTIRVRGMAYLLVRYIVFVKHGWN
jgi:hypothetical protein